MVSVKRFSKKGEELLQQAPMQGAIEENDREKMTNLKVTKSNIAFWVLCP